MLLCKSAAFAAFSGHTLGVKIHKKPSMLKVPIISIIIICLFQLGCKQQTEPKKDDISVTAKICGKANRVSKMDSTSRIYFFINLTLTNRTNSSKSIWFYSCSWMSSWKIEPNSLFFYSEGCDSNYPKKIDLKPDQSVNFNGIILNRNNLSDSNHFRVGFTEFNELELKAMNSPHADHLIKKINPRIYWSDWMALNFLNNSYEIIK